MTINSQNPARGRAFEQRVGQYLTREGYDVNPDYEVEVTVNGRLNKAHRFDWGSGDLLVECKAYSWTEGGNSPSAKFATANEAMLYFVATPASYKKMLFMPKTEKVGKLRPETLIEHYVRRYGHFIPDGVEIYELDESDLSATRVWPPQTN